jgi:hypothetical protein
VEIALDALLGRTATQGRPPKNPISVLIEIAKRYFASFQSGRPPLLDPIIWTVLQETLGINTNVDEDGRKNLIAPLRKLFNTSKDRLLTLATSDGQDALHTRNARVDRIARLLRESGIDVAEFAEPDGTSRAAK